MELPGWEARITLVATTAAALILGAVFFMVWPLQHSRPVTAPPADSGVIREIQAHLNAVSLGMLGYLSDHDAQYLESVKEECQQINRLLREYQHDHLAGSPKDGDRIDTSFQNLNDATHSLIKAEQSEADVLVRLGHNRERLFSIFTEQMEPSVRPSQLNATNRLRALLQAETEAKGLFVNRNGQILADTKKFRNGIEQFLQLSRSRRMNDAGDEALGLYDRAVANARKITVLEAAKKSYMQTYFESYQEMNEELRDVMGKIPAPSLPAQNKWWWLPSGVLMTLFMGLTFWTVRTMRRRMIRPLKELISATEAAATGDLTRVPDLWSHDEIGRMSQALHRLILVLSRSENLVYHLATLVDSTGEAIISETLDGTILSWNKGAQRLYGYSAEEVKGRSISVLTPADGGEQLMALLSRVKKGERIQPFEMIHEGKNGRVVHVFLRAACILDSTKKVIGASLCAQDITGANLLPASWKQPAIKASVETTAESQ